MLWAAAGSGHAGSDHAGSGHAGSGHMNQTQDRADSYVLN